MRKHQTLLIAGILLLGSAGVAQAQVGAGVYEVFSNAVVAREGGAAETSGNVVLFLRTGRHASGVITLRYSAPLAKGTMPMVTRRQEVTLTDEDRKENRVRLTMPSRHGHHNAFQCSSRPARGGSACHDSGFGECDRLCLRSLQRHLRD